MWNQMLWEHTAWQSRVSFYLEAFENLSWYSYHSVPFNFSIDTSLMWILKLACFWRLSFGLPAFLCILQSFHKSTSTMASSIKLPVGWWLDFWQSLQDCMDGWFVKWFGVSGLGWWQCTDNSEFDDGYFVSAKKVSTETSMTFWQRHQLL